VRISNTFKGLAVATVVALAAAGPALAAPAGSEYVPQVPSATGNTPIDQYPTGGVANSANPAPIAKKDASGDASAKDKSDKDVGTDNGASALPVLTDAASGNDESSGALDKLSDPSVLLAIAGVLLIAIGLALAWMEGGNGSDRPRPRRRRPLAAPTPDGQIIAGSDSPH
jgi:hypothetical protein